MYDNLNLVGENMQNENIDIDTQIPIYKFCVLFYKLKFLFCEYAVTIEAHQLSNCI